MPDMQEYHGSLVALEGPGDIVATQLRLLPKSPKILVLPPVQHFMKDEPKKDVDASSYVLKVHEAFNARTEMALSFLRDSTAANKRVVFMEGGTAGAQAKCVEEISRLESCTDKKEAEEIFRTIIKNGVAGLKRRAQGSISSKGNRSSVSCGTSTDGPVTNSEDPFWKAMRAADALDRQTAGLQPSTDIDLALGNARKRSRSVPLRPVQGGFHERAPSNASGAPAESSVRGSWTSSRGSRVSTPDSLRSTQRDSGTSGLFDHMMTKGLNRGSRLSRQFLDDRDSDRTSVSSIVDYVGEPYGLYPFTSHSTSAIDLYTPKACHFESRPSSPVLYGEATVVDVRASLLPTSTQLSLRHSTTPHKRIKSLDRIYASGIRSMDISLCDFRSWRPQSFVSDRIRGTMTPVPESPDRFAARRAKFFSQVPRATFVKPNKTIIRRSSPAPLDLTRILLKQNNRRPYTYADRGTNPEHEYVSKSTMMGPDYADRGVDATRPKFVFSKEIVEPVLPLVEHLVIHLGGEKKDILLEAILQTLREGVCSNTQSTTKAASENVNVKANLGSTVPEIPDTAEIISPQPKPISNHAASDDYDPFSSNTTPFPSATEELTDLESRVLGAAPPTPAQTPPPTLAQEGKAFHDLSIVNCKTAVCIQNLLRSVLNIYFSPEELGYHQFSSPLLPQSGNVWSPMFGKLEPGTTKKEGGRLDLILAVGAQQDVSREFLSSVTGSLEKLGTKPSGVSRSGRLDLRYLIANAMQAFTSQPLANQVHDNPFANPLLLATTIIPFLEIHIAAHPETRFLLLEYSVEHLPAVLALQGLLGVDLIKVTVVLNAESKHDNRLTWNPTSRNNSRRGPESARSSSGSAIAPASPEALKVMDEPPFAQANFSLTSSANDSEVATLISTIWKILVDTSDFYVPEGAPRHPNSQFHTEVMTNRSSKEEPRRSLSSSTRTNNALTNAAAMMGFHQVPPALPPTTIISIEKSPESPIMQPPEIPSRHGSKPMKSSSENPRLARTVERLRQQGSKLAWTLGAEPDNATLYPPDTPTSSKFEISDDDEGRFAADERMYMPLYGKQLDARKGNTRKALKFLGLA